MVENLSLKINELETRTYSQWDQFVLRHPHGSPFHLIAWKKTMEDTFGYRPHYLWIEEADQVRAVLPLFLVKSFLTGKALISSPFAVYGGILADSDAARQALFLEARSLAEKLQVDYLELRNGHCEQCVGVDQISQYFTFTQQVGPDEAALMQSLPSKVRTKIRKAMAQSFKTRRQLSDCTAFERLYSASLRRLGTPSFPPQYFAALLENFRDMIDIQEVLLDGRVVAASMNFYFRDQMHTYYGGYDPSLTEVAVSNYMFFDLLRVAGKSGYTTFDYGRSKEKTGSFDFKRHWGASMRKLPYEILLVRSKERPNYSPSNPKLKFAIECWKRLPLSITRKLGPKLIRMFP